MATLREHLEELVDEIGGSRFKPDGWEVPDLKAAIDDALAVQIKGDPQRLQAMAAVYDQAFKLMIGVQDDVEAIAKRGVPEVWTGTAGAMASETLVASVDTVNSVQIAYMETGQALEGLASSLKQAQEWHKTAQGNLQMAKDQLSGMSFAFIWSSSDHAQFLKARKAALTGVETLRDAVIKAEKDGEFCTYQLNKVKQAQGMHTDAPDRAALLRTDQLSDAGKLVLADTRLSSLGSSEKTDTDDYLLSSGQLERAGQALDKMSAADRERFWKLYDGTPGDTTSGEERAYLMQALAVGRYRIDDLERFAETIHRSGDNLDSGWLQKHLSPTYTSDDTGAVTLPWKVSESNGKYDSDLEPAQMVVMGRAAVDPLYALKMTTGVDATNAQGFDPNNIDDSGFPGRLHDEQTRILDHSRNFVENLGIGSGMDTSEVGDAANDMFPNGYHTRAATDDDSWDNFAFLPDDIEKALAGGNPVMLTVEGGDGERPMAILPRGDSWVVYDPGTGLSTDYSIPTTYTQVHKDVEPYTDDEFKIKTIYLPN